MEEYSKVEEIPVLDNKTVDMGAVLQGTDFSEEIEDVDVLSEMVTESVQMCSGQISLASEAANNLMSRKLGSVDYLVSVENYKLITDVLASNLGVKPFVPALEDFGSKFALEASHEVAMEGFLNFIKKMWAKIKSFFLEFFKKVGQFIKRISGANLEIDAYEKYVDDIIRKIKRKQLVLGDNTVKLESRLPSLVADLTTSEFNDYSEVLNKAETKMKVLAYELKSMNDPTKLKNTENSLKAVREILDDIIKEAVSDSPDITKLKSKLDEIKNTLTTTLSSYYLPENLSSNEVPSDVYENILRVSENVNISDLKIRSMVKPGEGSHSLPKLFNTYLAIGVNKGTYIKTSSELNSYVSSRIPPIGTIENLEKFYKTYQEFSKSYNIKDSDAVLNRMSKDIDVLVTYMETKYGNTINTVNNTVRVMERLTPYAGGDVTSKLKFMFTFVDKITEGITDKRLLSKMYEELTALHGEEYKNIFKESMPELGAELDIPLRNKTFVESENFHLYDGMDHLVYGILSPELIGGNHKAISTKDRKNRKFVDGVIEYFKHQVEQNPGVSASIDDNINIIINKLNEYLKNNNEVVSNPKELLEILSAIQESIVPFLNTYKSHVTSVATDLSAIYTETRGAAIKYIYDSARLYH